VPSRLPRETALRAGFAILAVLILALPAYLLYAHPPVESIGRGELGVRINRLSGEALEWREGSVLVLPGLHEAHVYPLRDQLYRPLDAARADGPAPFQSQEGLSIGVDLQVRYALDPARLRALNYAVPEDFGAAIVEPAVQGAIYKAFARYTVREIFSTKRAELQQAIEADLKDKLAAEGLVLRGVVIGKVDLPADYRRGMEALLAEELASEKMRYTLELKAKRVKESELEAEAQKVRRQKAAEAERFARVRMAEGNARARKIEAAAEARARQKLAQAEAYRLEQVGRANAAQLGREGPLVTQNPLLVQKAFADKLSERVQVIIAPTPTDGSFIGSALVGAARR
jgi:regulator of protease activity HflC (stomatin/prohibitin superfamily)